MSVLDELDLGWRRRLPMILQSEAAECGLACLAMIAAFHGSGQDLAQLRRRFGLSLKGATLLDLTAIADHLELAARPLRMEMHELPQLALPCLLHWDLNHFVVLKRIDARGILIHDPALGVRRVTLAETARRFTGIAMELVPTPGFAPGRPPARVKLGALVRRMVGIKGALAQLAVLALAIELFAVVSPFFMQWVVDEALVSGDRELLGALAVGFALLLVIRVAVSAMRGWLLIAISNTVKVMGRTNLFSHLIHLPAGYFETRHLGDVMSRFGSQETILQALTTDMVEVILDGLMSLFTLVVMFVYSPSLAMIVVAGALLYATLRWASYTPLRHASSEAIVWAARRDSHFLETLRGMKTIKLFNGQDGRQTYWLNLLVQTVNRQIATQKLNLLFRVCHSLLVGAIAIIIVWMGAARVLDQTFSVGMLFAFISYKDQFLSRVSDLTNKVLDLHMLHLHAERLADIALTEPEQRGERVPAPPALKPRSGAAIEVRDLRYRYGAADPWVLDGVSFRIEAGESVAIVGPSGCGKTTLLRLLASLLEPTSGDILVDGQPLTRTRLAAYRGQIGVVLQDDHLFAGSLAENISFFSDTASQERIENAARMAAVHEDICAMAMGYGTLIGDMGTVLSGGQKQRILIARALYRQPAILLLDEATSHLDIARERSVNTAIQSARMTRIIVAHRPETIRSADRVIVLDKGKLVEQAAGEPGDALRMWDA